MRVIDGHSELAKRYAGRIQTLIGHCPVGKSLKVRDKERLVQCSRRADSAELDLKMELRSDVSGAALLHARFRLHVPPGCDARISLHHLEGRRETETLTGRQEKYLSALLVWAEQVLPTASPHAPGPGLSPWQRQFAELYHRLSGVSVPVARRRLRESFFVDQEDAPDSVRMEAFLDMLREEGWVALVDWREDTVDEIVLQLAEQRLASLRLQPAGPIDRAVLAAVGYVVVRLEDGSDQAVMALVANEEVAPVEHLLSDLAPPMRVRR